MTPNGNRLPAPLHGIRVLDFTHVLAGPFCTRLLADLGAEVLRVESSLRPDRLGAVRYDPQATRRQDRHPFYLNNNRNKQSIAIYLKHDGGKALAQRLAAKADVVVENFSAGVMQRLGLGYEQVSETNAGLVFISMSGYGNSGPRRDWTSMNMNLQGYSGMMLATGAPGDPPTLISNSWNDYIGGFHATFAVMEALAERHKTGLGRYIDLSQFECSAATLAPALIASAHTGTPPRRLGNRALDRAPQGAYPCAGQDEWCTLSVETDAQWQALGRVVGHPEWRKDARLRHLAGRLERHDDLDAGIAAWTLALSAAEVEARLRGVGIPAQRMRRIAELSQDKAGGGVFVPIDDPPGTPTTVTTFPVEFSVSGRVPPSPSPKLGEHTDRALREWLGLGDREIATLHAQGILD